MSISFSVSGLRPGMSRGDVVATLGCPNSDGWEGACPAAIYAPALEAAPVWVYRDRSVSVVFRGDDVQELIGNALEADGQVVLAQGQSWNKERFHSLSANADSDGVYTEWASRGLSLHPEPLPQVRLRRKGGEVGRHVGGPFLRERLAAANGLAAWQFFPHRTVPGALFAMHVLQVDPALATKVHGGPGSAFVFKPYALQRALGECLTAGTSYVTGWRGKESFGCVAEGENERVQAYGKFLAGLEGKSLVCTSDVTDDECWVYLQKLRWTCSGIGRLDCGRDFAFHPHECFFSYGNNEPFFEGDLLPQSKLNLVLLSGIPSPFLKLCACLDAYQEPSWLLTDRDLDWTQQFAIRRLHDARLLPVIDSACNDGCELFLAMQTRRELPAGPGPLSLSIISQMASALRAVGGECADLSTLHTPLDLHLMRKIEQFPYPYFARRNFVDNRREPAYHYVRFLGYLARDAAHFMPRCVTPAQRALALGLAIVLENGLRALGCSGEA